ncbi:MAG: lytic transglycosylase domain-containing protein [Eubacteriales bacterium]|nr:lytic transglycosylase domain-containing protein [Eubacteriales bacterium]
MSYMTTGRVDTLQIQPLVSHTGEKGRRTTITSFQTMLQTEQSASTASDQKTSSTASAQSQSGVIFRDPVTGKAVRYVEVGSEDASSTDETKSQSKSATYTQKTSSNSKTTSASSMKTTKYDAYFKKAAKKYGVSESLLKAIAKAESNFNARDLSSSGAMGVMQLMPETARSLGVDDPYDPEQNIMGGAKCIAQKLKEFDGDVKLALAAYNAGSGAVKRAGGIPSKCQSYIKKVLSYQEAYETAKKVG